MASVGDEEMRSNYLSIVSITNIEIKKALGIPEIEGCTLIPFNAIGVDGDRRRRKFLGGWVPCRPGFYRLKRHSQLSIMTFERCSKKHDINPVVYQSIGGNDKKQSVKQFCCISFYDESKK